MSNRQNAYTEVYTILQELEENEYEKIPPEIIQALEKNKNDNYIYELDDEQELKEQQMLPETKAILFNIFRDYLATPEQKQKVIQMQNEERQKLELKKKQKYSNNVFENGAKVNNRLNENIEAKQQELIEQQQRNLQQINEQQFKQKQENDKNYVQETRITTYKQNIFQKIINKIKQWMWR